MSSTKLIAKNTVMLYVRMLCSVCINFYASRVILEALGVEDFGIYNIVAGIVTMLGFLNTTMSGCTSRFMTYELGKGDHEKLKKTFSGALQIHLLIGIAVLLIGESVGLWFVNTQLDIPEGKMLAANWVYQFSLLSAIISFVQVPYTAAIIAHERMGVYAYIEILKVLFKLGACFIVVYIAAERLTSYSILLFIGSMIVFVAYVLYCRRHFEEVAFRRHLHKDIIKPMLKFTAWDLYGNASVVIQQQGTNILINRFFGVVLNAASGVATQASSALSMFVNSFTMALRPPIIKKYASGDMEELQKLLLIAIVVCLLLAEIICLPLYLRIDYLMGLWLKDVPPYSVQFCKWMLLANSIGIINTIFTTLIHATGRIRYLSLIGGSLYLSTVLFSYLAFRYSCPPQFAYMILLIVTILVLSANIVISRKQIPELSGRRIIKGLLVPVAVIAMTILVSLFMDALLPAGFWGVVSLFAVNALTAVVMLYVAWVGPKYGWNPIKLIRREV